jgi:ATP-binding cassette subfamily C exporter for protease/lipase
MLQKLFYPRHVIGQALITVKPALRQAAAFSLVLNLLYLVPSLYMLQVYDRVLTSYNLTTLAMLTAIVVVAYACMACWTVRAARC